MSLFVFVFFLNLTGLRSQEACVSMDRVGKEGRERGVLEAEIIAQFHRRNDLVASSYGTKQLQGCQLSGIAL